MAELPKVDTPPDSAPFRLSTVVRKEHLTFSNRTSLLRKLAEPEWGTRKVADITPEDVGRLFAKVSKGRPRPRKHPPKPSPRRSEMKGGRCGPTPIRANRVDQILRKMLNLAIPDGRFALTIRPSDFHASPKLRGSRDVSPATRAAVR